MMKCNNCNVEVEADVKVCPECGASIEETPAQTPVESPSNETVVAEKAESAGFVAACKGIVGKIDAAVGKVFGNKKTYVYAGAIGVLALILIVSAIIGLIPESNGYLTVEASQLVPYDETLYLMKDGKLSKIKIGTDSFSDYKVSIDYSVYAVVGGDDELFVVKGNKAKKVAEDVSDVSISLYGDAIIYRSGEDDCYYYCKTSSGKSVKMFESGDDGILRGEFVFSPDGKSVSYLLTEDSDTDLYFFNGKKAEKIASTEGKIIGMSNGGKYIYVVESGEKGPTLYTLNKKGDKNKINSCAVSGFSFNLDATEVKFYDDGRTYISVKGKEPQRVASKQISLMTPRYTNSFSITGISEYYPVESLYKHVYTAEDSVYFVSKSESKNTKIINGATSIKLDDSAEYVYFKEDGELMCAKIAHGANAESKAKLISEDAGSYVVSSDRKYVYFIDDGSLYVVNGKKGGKAKMLSNDDVSSGIIISDKDVVYYTSDGAVFAAKGRSKGKQILDDASFTSVGGSVYLMDEDTLYAARGTSKPKKLLDR